MKPVYDGRKATVLGVVEGDGGLSLRVTSDGVLCATGHARLDGDPPAAPALADYPTAPLPDHATRPVASPESIVPGAVLGTYELDLKADLLAQYLEDVREDGPLYARDTIAHPGYLLRLANRAVAENVRLGPWIHVGSKIQNHAVARAGDRLAARASVTKEYTHKGHRFVEADVLVVANGETPITQIDHTAIYQPRQVTEG